MPNLPESILCRRAAAREFLGLSEQEFTKLVTAGVLQPLYLVWDVVDKKNVIVFSTTQAKAHTYVAENGNRLTAQPAGLAFFRTAEVRALARAEKAQV